MSIEKIWWNVRFCYWALRIGIPLQEIMYWANQGYLESQDTSLEYLPPKRSVRFTHGWMRK